MTVRVVYHDGAFVPVDNCEISEGTEGLVTVAGGIELKPAAERHKLLADLTDAMKSNPFLPGRPRLTRDQMHERD